MEEQIAPKEHLRNSVLVHLWLELHSHALELAKVTVRQFDRQGIVLTVLRLPLINQLGSPTEHLLRVDPCNLPGNVRGHMMVQILHQSIKYNNREANKWHFLVRDVRFSCLEQLEQVWVTAAIILLMGRVFERIKDIRQNVHLILRQPELEFW